MKVFLFLASLAVLAVAAPASGDRPSAAGASGAVVFSSTRDGEPDIYAVNSDGTGLTQLTNDAGEDYSPIPSPDGQHILFYADDVPTVINADGTGRHALRDCSLEPGGWSPDSRHFVCSAYEEGLLILDTVDGTVKPLADSGSKPVWSPDGRNVAFVDENRLFIVPAAGGTRRRLGILRVGEFAAPAWSPDSQRVAYISPGNGLDVYTLWTIRADGSGGRRVAQRVGEDSPRWSPDGSRIAFLRWLPHEGKAVYTIRNDGTGVHRVTSDRTGEYASAPAWSADGRLVLYSRARFRGAEEADIYAVRPGGRGGRALTHPFPTGGTNSYPQWIVGLRLSGHEPSPRTIALPLGRRLTFPAPISGVVSDGHRAIPKFRGERGGSVPLLIWDPNTGRTVRGPGLCGESYGPGGPVLAGRRLAWICGEAGNTFYGSWLQTQRLGRRKPATVASAYGEMDGDGDSLGSLVGRGGTIAFTNYHEGAHEGRDAWLLLAHKGSKCPAASLYGGRSVCKRLTRADGGATVAVDAGRVLTIAPSGLVRLLSTQNRVLRGWSLDEGIVTARLRGRTLAVQHGTSVDTYDTTTGAKARTRALAADEGPTFLLDVQGDLAVYKTGGAIHLLRLSDGRDVAVRIPGAAPALDARLEPAGLFLSWNQMHGKRPGHLAFIPLRSLRPRLR
jgi:TolB protein